MFLVLFKRFLEEETSKMVTNKRTLQEQEPQGTKKKKYDSC